MKVRSKRTWVLLGVIAAVAALASVGAYAYFTANGSGSGQVDVGSASAIVITSDLNGDLYPDGPDVPVDVHVNNPGSGNQFVNDVSGVVADSGGCDGDWFQVDTIDLNANIDAGDTVDTSTDVRMLDNGASQDACQGLTLTINWSSNERKHSRGGRELAPHPFVTS
jgi:hypothetical protein